VEEGEKESLWMRKRKNIENEVEFLRDIESRKWDGVEDKWS
jgi:hypothetical protein